MKVYRIPVTWETFGVMEIEANSIEEAIKEADDHPYPSILDNTDGSQEVNFELIEHFNPGEKIKTEPLKEELKCPKCGKSLHKTLNDGLWCPNMCFLSEYHLWEAMQKAGIKKG